jgi:Flp pilus assembly pilin Flp
LTLSPFWTRLRSSRAVALAAFSFGSKTHDREEGEGMGYLSMMFVRAQNAWFAARDKESGQTLVEYVLIISLIALAALAALGFLSGRIQSIFSDAGNSLP